MPNEFNDTWRRDFPILAADENGQRLVYLDSAATTQHPVQVLIQACWPPPQQKTAAATASTA